MPRRWYTTSGLKRQCTRLLEVPYKTWAHDAQFERPAELRPSNRCGAVSCCEISIRDQLAKFNIGKESWKASWGFENPL